MVVVCTYRRRKPAPVVFLSGLEVTLHRRSSKRIERHEPKFGHDPDTYEEIRARVLKERAVTNAIEALQERWRMLTFMFDDCIQMNEGRKERVCRKLSIKRQFELIVILGMFLTFCVPVFVLLVVICR